MAKKTIKKAGLNPFMKMLSAEKGESTKKEKSEKNPSKMDKKVDKILGHKKGKNNG